ncbi:uncharacterized protein BKCO1_3300035 [Diplodia corticola]|uniref:Cyclin-D1-binding protein 1-like N-terminal domain-containing protein n=1 Tax=Diplodia corticola TaxID=236234 RepID=A0A1J9RKK0_9PEZI|nr:uncharacterized protein BKCO1_3300035 [Diplodia corticola]OJD33115.1 hypothetical protein BKCO1_3300035 [Diplodia corticola]
MPPNKPSSDLPSLIDLTTSTSTLLTHFHASLAPPPTVTSSSSPHPATTTSTTTPVTPSTPTPLALLADTAALLKAHTTKLSLLLLNDPFTPSAIASVLRDMADRVVPAMMAGAEAVSGQQQQSSFLFPAVVVREVRARVRRIVGAVAEEVGEVRGRAVAEAEAKAKAEGGKGKKGKVEGNGGRGALSSTGLVWEACDALVEVKEKGVVGVVVGQVEGWRGMVVDAVEELKEWGEEGEDEDDDEEDGLDGSGDEDEDDIFGGGGGGDKLGKGNEELRAQLDATLKKVKTITVLYQALVKRRLKTYPAGGSDASAVETLDRLLDILQRIPDSVDDMASAYYDLDGEEAKKAFAKISADAVRASDLVKQSWDGKDDEFTTWAGRFQDAIKA